MPIGIEGGSSILGAAAKRTAIGVTTSQPLEIEMDQIVFTLDDIASILRVSKRKIQKMVAAKKFLQPFYIGDLPRWLKKDVLAWIEKNFTPGACI